MKVRKKNKTDLCLTCSNEFLHYAWDTQKYCSRICSNNKDKVEVLCSVCDTSTLKSKSLVERNDKNYCSRECYNFRNGLHKKLKRNTIFYKQLLETTTCKCGENTSYLLQIHHIDGNNKHNEINNLEVVCANCHIKRHLKQSKTGKWIYHPKSLTDRNILDII
jgi:hypothetical protein